MIFRHIDVVVEFMIIYPKINKILTFFFHFFFYKSFASFKFKFLDQIVVDFRIKYNVAGQTRIYVALLFTHSLSR